MSFKYLKVFLAHLTNWQNSVKNFCLYVCSHNAWILFPLHFVLARKWKLATENAWVFLVLSKHILKIKHDVNQLCWLGL